MIEKKHRAELDRLYQRYGFSRSEKGADVCVYYLRQGYYFGADVVPLVPGAQTAAIESELREAGFGVNVRTYSSVDEAHQKLYDGFFSSAQSAERLNREYKTFESKQSKSLGTPYQYVQCRYSLNDIEKPQGSLIDDVLGVLSGDGPKLVLLEAAAGFGKTCSAYEISRALLAGSSASTPILAELSRNRQARIFKYVLLDEIDRCYRGLGYELVKHEIQSGRIPLIVDGFDELLRGGESQGNVVEEFESIETMLDTIGDLLVDNAKIVLTTRRTAVFSDDRFSEWLDTRGSTAHLTRITIREPDVSDWIGPDRLEALSRAEVPIRSLANPVLLSHVRSLTTDGFAKLCEDPDELVRSYFSGLLEREKERQNLLLDVSVQLSIFRTVARAMAEVDSLSAPRSQVTATILNKHGNDLEATRRLYPMAERPAVEELAETLAGHALLDRAGKDSALVSFINDFVFGTLVGEALLADTPEDWPGTEPIVARVVTAFRTRSPERRAALWASLMFASEFLPPRDQLMFDFELQGRTIRQYSGASFERISVANVAIGDSPINSSTFVRCVFTRCNFHVNSLRDVGFLECKFFDCSCDSPASEPTGVWTRGCFDAGSGLLFALEGSVHSEELMAHPEIVFERQVIERFWAINRSTPNTQREIKAFFSGVEQKHHAAINRALETLRSRGLLTVVGSSVRLNETRLSEIRKIAGKDQ